MNKPITKALERIDDSTNPNHFELLTIDFIRYFLEITEASRKNAFEYGLHRAMWDGRERDCLLYRAKPVFIKEI